MLNLIIWWAGILFEVVALVQGYRAKLLTRYSSVYLYLLALFLSDGLLYPVYRINLEAYFKWNIFLGYIVLFLGCGVILEVFRHSLAIYSGAEKVAKAAGTAVLIGILGFAVAYLWLAPRADHASAVFIRVQRDFLMVQAVLLIVLLRVISYYGIALGRNLKGIIFGFGQCVGMTLITLTLRGYIGTRFQVAWSYIQPTSYLLLLVIWIIALWSYGPNPDPESRISGGGDYDALAARTRQMVNAAGTQLVKVERL